jgi:3-hydroxyacyl-CoA dehydrogenase/enoyl-CoA hydratase/3-hydroxybutyryl-CoA epimerase
VESSGNIRWEEDGVGVVVLTLDDPNRSANTMTDDFVADLRLAVERLEDRRQSLAGVVIASAKESFFAGGDLDRLRAVDAETIDELSDHAAAVTSLLRRLEVLRLPVAAAIAGPALGGGLEIALACNRRLVADSPAVRLGLPEVTLGLMPGAGGTARAVRLLGLLPALDSLLLDGRALTAGAALELGLVDEVVEPDELLAAARSWIGTEPDPSQPWDREGYQIPGGAPGSRELWDIQPTLPANLRKKLRGANYPAPQAILAAAVEGAQVDLDGAVQIERRYFDDLAVGPVAKNMIQAFHFDRRSATGSRGRVGQEPFRPRKVLVLGAGMMGAGIAYSCAKVGIDVVLKDVSAEAAAKGRAYSEGIVAKGVAAGRTSPASGEALLDRIVATDDVEVGAGADLVIEAVFEEPDLKRAVLAEALPVLAADALLASNTSSLPIADLATGLERPRDFLGMHFFSPVDRMPLLEIVKSELTDPETVGRALDVARAIGKVPIVVNDSRGFFTSRVIQTFLNEGIAMLLEGIAPASIEQASLQAGYPAPVLALNDEVNLKLRRDVREQARRAVRDEGGAWSPHPSEAVIDRMIDDFGRSGRLAGGGFYDYEDGRRAGLWAALGAAFGPGSDGGNVPFEDLKERLLFVESLEAVRCYESHVIESVADANIGSILGIGYPGWTGGVLQYVTNYSGGPAGYVARTEELAELYGDRFEPTPLLIEMAAEESTFEDLDRVV